MASKTKNNVYFPVESLVGLGHFNRTGKLVREMVANGLDVTVASGTFVDPERFFAGAKIRQMPSYVFQGTQGNHYTLDAQGKRTALPCFNVAAHRAKRMRAHIKNIAENKPGIVFSEFWPFDRPTLDSEMLSLLKKTPRAQHIVSVRDVIDVPLEKREEREARAVKIINKHFNTVLVHGDPRFVPLDETFNAVNEIKKEIVYTGYVVDDLPKRAQPDLKTGTLLVSCGSGVDADDMVLSFLDAWDRLVDEKHKDVTYLTKRPVHIVCGPRFDGRAFEEVERWARALSVKHGQEIRVEKYRPDLTSLIAGAAFSVSLAGYNTTLETLAIGTPALLIPKYARVNGSLRISSEQLYRLKRLEQKGFAAYAHPDDVENSARFAEILVHSFVEQTSSRRVRPRLDFDGAKRTIGFIG